LLESVCGQPYLAPEPDSWKLPASDELVDKVIADPQTLRYLGNLQHLVVGKSA
jgi:hypothetical protein